MHGNASVGWGGRVGAERGGRRRKTGQRHRKVCHPTQQGPVPPPPAYLLLEPRPHGDGGARHGARGGGHAGRGAEGGAGEHERELFIGRRKGSKGCERFLCFYPPRHHATVFLAQTLKQRGHLWCDTGYKSLCVLVLSGGTKETKRPGRGAPAKKPSLSLSCGRNK